MKRTTKGLGRHKRKRYWLALRTLRGKLLFRSLLLVAIILFLVGIFQYVFIKQYTYQNKADSMLNQVVSIPPETWRQNGVPLPRPEGVGTKNPYWTFKGEGQRSTDQSNKEDQTKKPSSSSSEQEPEKTTHNGKPAPMLFLPGLSMAYIDENGQYSILSEWNDAGTPPVLSTEEYKAVLVEAKSRREPSSAYRVMDNPEGKEQLVVFFPVPFNDPYALVQISSDTDRMNNELNRQLLIYIVLSLIALGAGIIAFLPMLKKTLMPLSNMVHSVEQINAGSLEKRLSVSQGQEEIDKLSISFNEMLERLQASFEAEKEAKEQMRQFIADASHELRTPLTSIHGFLEVLLRGASQQPEQLDRALRSMYGESERMNKLVHDLLLLAKLDRAPQLTIRTGRLGGMIQEMEPQLRLLAAERQVSFELDVDTISAFDTDKLKQVILNLFYNAVQHTDPHTGAISLSLVTRNNEHLELSVRDNGIGVDEEHLPLLFNRFYRKDSARARKHGGAGLGLAITKSIIDLHGGEIRVTSEVGKGTAFRIKLPIHIDPLQHEKASN
ncbi:sensor histidine kinase [Paenibacillus sp. 1001270B_150601_E10]|uniref:sensor histidine kinase n=1 Tax=Paenibacillus sp. 1001270B_150601_E10 TaxID=2787079 RepID=UPI00189EF93E|nr:ATP-binding protein [Paenibacillus sp. 1001270B_150601_E10]